MHSYHSYRPVYNFRKVFLSFSICMLLLTTADVFAQKFEFSPHRKKATLSFKLIKNLMIIEITVNGSGPFNFVLDTGVGLLVISDPKMIETVAIKNLRNIKITGFGDGEPLSAFVTPSLEIGVGGMLGKNISGAILKKDVFELSNYVGMPIHGLIGYEFFNSFIVKINFVLNTITLYRPEIAYLPKKGVRIPLIIEDRKPYIMSEITLESGEKIDAKLIVDTGAGHPLSLETIDGIPFDVPKINIPGNLGIGLTGPISGYISRIPSIKLGKYVLNDVIASFPDYEDVGSKVYSVSRNGNMGIPILKRFNVIFDYNSSVMYLKQSSALKEAFEHDMSGLELSSEGDEFERLRITRVEKGSAADDAGLQPGDEILSVNFKPVKDMSLSEVDELFRSRSERGFILDIVPYGQTIKNKERVILTLKRRI